LSCPDCHEEDVVRRYLVVAHQTLTSSELLEAMKAHAAEEETAFHLLVPMYHGGAGLSWTDLQSRAVAQEHLDAAIARMSAEGLSVSGEVGCDNPVDAVTDVMYRERDRQFARVIVSTLPHTISKWLKVDVPSRIQRHTTLPVEHLIGYPAAVPA
jgi:hypothetical protein